MLTRRVAFADEKKTFQSGYFSKKKLQNDSAERKRPRPEKAKPRQTSPTTERVAQGEGALGKSAAERTDAGRTKCSNTASDAGTEREAPPRGTVIGASTNTKRRIRNLGRPRWASAMDAHTR